MALVIDGHNLIPKILGMSLADLDDEPHLIHLVQEYCRLRRNAAELFFDGALPGTPAGSGGGLVHVHSVRKGMTADQAMIDFLTAKGKSARNYTLVSSDRRVQTEARSLGCSLLSAEQFAADLMNTISQAVYHKKEQNDPLSNEEVKNWLNIFGEKKEKK